MTLLSHTTIISDGERRRRVDFMKECLDEMTPSGRHEVNLFIEGMRRYLVWRRGGKNNTNFGEDCGLELIYEAIKKGLL